MHQRREQGTIAAAISYFRFDLLTDVVGWLWIVSYVGIRRLLYPAIGNTLPTRWRWALLLALELSAWQPLWQIGPYAAPFGKGHCGGMMRGGGGGKIGGRKVGGDNIYNRWVSTSINHGGCQWPMATIGPNSRLLSIQQSANILWDRTKLLKIEKNIGALTSNNPIVHGMVTIGVEVST